MFAGLRKLTEVIVLVVTLFVYYRHQAGIEGTRSQGRAMGLRRSR